MNQQQLCVLLLIILAPAAGIAQSGADTANSSPFQTGTQLELNRSKAIADSKASHVGQQFWFVPNPEQNILIKRTGFFKSLDEKDLSTSAKLYPTEIIHFRVIEKIAKSSDSSSREFYRVELSDGTSAFIKANNLESPVGDP